MLRGGTQRATGLQSVIRASSIIAIKGKDFIVRHFDHEPTLTKEMLIARDRYMCAYCAQRFRFDQLDMEHIKDVILPGEMKEILNRVVEAEKVAQANLIKHREETAATRSLLNTARLMDENPTLLRLKELETLERSRRRWTSSPSSAASTACSRTWCGSRFRRTEIQAEPGLGPGSVFHFSSG